MNPTQNQPAEVHVTPADILRAAALYIERHGWTQWLYYNRDATDGPFPPACAIGGIRIAVYGDTTGLAASPADNALVAGTQRHLAAHLDPDFYVTEYDAADVIGDWNDEGGRTAGQVIAALRAAADEWDRIHGGAQ